MESCTVKTEWINLWRIDEGTLIWIRFLINNYVSVEQKQAKCPRGRSGNLTHWFSAISCRPAVDGSRWRSESLSRISRAFRQKLNREQRVGQVFSPRHEFSSQMSNNTFLGRTARHRRAGLVVFRFSQDQAPVCGQSVKYGRGTLGSCRIRRQPALARPKREVKSF